ncbi:MAG: DNA polymerase IV [Geminicoccaceae bacterium]|nr:MAG: DNA polymerase IV [Geminicoccaceae bacterium]
MRKIIHVDMDAFFAAVEQRDDAGLRGRPIAVGGAAGRGVVMTASYEARPFGVRSAMPSVTAKRLCPDLVFVPARMDVYREVSRQLRGIFRAHADAVEPLSLDEAYLDVTQSARTVPAIAIARKVKAEIQALTGLTASAGVSVNKFLAKIASDMDKPDGLTVIRPEEVDRFVAALPVERFHGVGPVTAQKLHDQGLRTGADLRLAGYERLVGRFGRLGAHLFHIAHGRDDREVTPDRVRKSVGCEQTFAHDLRGLDALAAALEPIALKLEARLRQAGARPLTLTLKVKDDRFRLQTRARRHARPVLDAPSLLLAGRRLLDEAELERPVRLLGLAGSHFEAASDQLDLFDLTV